MSNLFRAPADAPSTGSLLAPILANASSAYGAVAAEPARAQTTSTQQSTPCPGSVREAAGTLGQLASVSFPLGAQTGMHRASDDPPSSHSSLPHDAIQAEAARQLEGIMARARQAEQENLLLREQLSALTAEDNSRVFRAPNQHPSPATPDLAASGQQRPATEGQDQEFAAVEALPEQERLHVLGEALAARVRGYDSMYVGVIVDVLLQEPTTDILSMLRDPASLEQCVAEVQTKLGLASTTSIPQPSATPISPSVTLAPAPSAPQEYSQPAVAVTAREHRNSWRATAGMLSDLMSGVQGSVGPRVGQDRVDATGVVQGTGAVPQQSHVAGSTTAPQAMPHVIETASTVGLGDRGSLRGSLGGIGLLGN